jgi:hypothetical protein
VVFQTTNALIRGQNTIQFMNQETIKVNGVRMTLKPYSEKRMKELTAINQEITDWVNKNLEATIDQVPSDLKGLWWKRKASILWESESLPDGFFTSDEFESSLLKDSEEFFTMKRLYL